MKQNILILALSRNPWIGGIYYRKNFIYMLTLNDKVMERFRIIIVTNKKYQKVFEEFRSKTEIVTCSDKLNYFNILMGLLKVFCRFKVKYIFPVKPYGILKRVGITPVSWIADFQHNHYPEYFDMEEINKRDKDFKYMARKENPLVVSSYNAYEDLQRFYCKDRHNVHVIHFTSYIASELKQLNQMDIQTILDHFGLIENEYIAVCNQFWQHKNHTIVFEAIQKLAARYPQKKIMIAFTGEPSDRRNPDYYQVLMAYLEDKCVRSRVKILGFVERREQLCVMKGAKFILQPSLFEGWGTVVEDAKVLEKKILLSDIPVHREQMDKNCTLFRPDDSDDLVQQILNIENKSYVKDFNFIQKTQEYAKALEKVFGI